MRESVRILACLFLLAPGLRSDGAQSVRLAAGTGRAAVPVFSGSGNLYLAGPDGAGGFELVPSGTAPGSDPAASGGILEAPSLGVSARTAPAGEIGVLWARTNGAVYEIIYGRFDGGRLLGRNVVRSADFPLFSPDLAYGADSQPWAVWIQRREGRDEVVVADIGRERSWVVNGPGLPNALGPKLLVKGDREAWAFWTGGGVGHDRVFSASLLGESWTLPRPIRPDAPYPQTSPAACLDAAGRPIVAWSEYDGNDYEILASFWTGAAWTAAEHVTDNADADLTPAIAFVPSAGPALFWSKTSRQGHAVGSSLRLDGAWSSETVIDGFRKDPMRSLGLASSGGRFGLFWSSGDEAVSRMIGLGEILQRAARGPETAGRGAAAPPFDPYRDENQYTTFGDSITYAEEHGYQPSLEANLVAKFGAARIWNEGVGGESTAEGLIRTDEAIAAHSSRYLLLMEGTNDVIFLDISMETAAFNLEEMARRGLRAGILPLIATIIPRKDAYWTTPPFQSRIVELNGRIRMLTAALAIPLVDQYETFMSYPEANGGWKSLILDDGVHPNAKGFTVMSGVWFGGIVSLPFPPVNVRAGRAANKILFYRQAGNLLLWRNSSKLDPAKIVAYRIYRKAPADAKFPAAYLGAVPFQRATLEFRFFDSTIETARSYHYVITALRADGVEGPCSDIARDDII